ncbi:hypothetical protein [Natrinema gari]|uniref:Uncharacterized protein n=1 Tax=Natrinema gari JCM 14663 TaxID=1230459 RepID=L9Z5Q1_9EURY|nr:hypothetical protein [Natrinema gari]ELY80987.1 hypothetical protein C486_07803 [Natrinema gari JCM 14663]
MDREQLFRSLTAALSLTGLALAVLGLLLETPVGVSLGALATVAGGVFYRLEHPPTTLEFNRGELPLSTILIQLGTMGALFLFISYLVTSITTVKPSALVVFPSSALLATSSALLGGVLGGIHVPLLRFGYYSRAIEQIAHVLPFGIFAGLVVISLTTCLPYALSYLICITVSIAYRHSNQNCQPVTGRD